MCPRGGTGYTLDLKSNAFKGVRVRLPSRTFIKKTKRKKVEFYVPHRQNSTGKDEGT
jgi:hypothetical protein